MIVLKNNRAHGSWRLLGTAVVGLIAAVSLTGCGSNGFQPLYATSSGGGYGSPLAKVKVATIPGRVGQRIRNELKFQSTGGGRQTTVQKYQLDVTIVESVTSTLVNAEGDSAGQIYQLHGSFKLAEITTGKVVLNGDSYGRAGFERFSSIFANVRARNDAENRAARSVATDMKSRLEAFLARS